MAQPGKHFDEGSGAPPPSKVAARDSEQNQLDFELEFFAGLLRHNPDYVDVLRIMGSLLALKGLFAEGLKIDRKLVRLRPADPLAHYNLACSYALLKRSDASIKTLRKAVELGYRDIRYMREDPDLDAIKQDPRFRQLVREYADE
jgi:tetratricopeptide (TPR) repeat protein